MEKKTLNSIVLTALFAALMAAGAFIRIPLPPVPITLQTLFVVVAGLCLPLRLSVPSFAVYLFLGLVGLPVFTSGGGPAALTGPTGGYIAGMIPAIVACGLMMKSSLREKTWWVVLAALAAEVCMYVPGLWWLSYSRSLSLSATLAAGLWPFLVGDAVKTIVAVIVSKKAGPAVDRLLSEGE